MNDITTSEDIKHLINSFYEKVKKDDKIGFIFNNVAQVNWEQHLPKMYAFWEFLLLGQESYKGNPFEAHKKLNEKVNLTREHFDQWLNLFHQTVDEHFSGLNAVEAKNRARLIAMTWIPKFEESC